MNLCTCSASCLTVAIGMLCAVLTGCAEKQVGHVLTYQVVPAAKSDGPATTEVAEAINRRLRHLGRAIPAEMGNIVVELYGSPDASELSSLKRLIDGMGVLEFRITAEPSRTNIAGVIAQAQSLGEDQTDVSVNGNRVAKWVAYAREEFGTPDVPDRRIVKRVAGTVPQALVLIDQWNVTGDYLDSARIGVDERGTPAVHFSFNSRGGGYFGQLTGENLPNRATGAYRYLAIILDDRMLSAPSINSVITDSGMISGGGMNEREVQHIVSILSAGRLPQAVKLVGEESVAITVRVPMSRQTAAILAILGAGSAVLLVIVAVTFAMKRRETTPL